MIVFDIGANRGEYVQAVLDLGVTKVVALEPAPRMFSVLARNYLRDSRILPLRLAASDKEWSEIEFYECVEDGLSTMNKDWLEGEKAPYGDKAYRRITAYTTTLDALIAEYGNPDLIKVDVEGAEYQVLQGLTKKSGVISFEWQVQWKDAIYLCLNHLKDLGYTEFAPQYITHHAVEPDEWFDISGPITFDDWLKITAAVWEGGDWKKYGLRPTADAGMIWVR